MGTNVLHAKPEDEIETANEAYQRARCVSCGEKQGEQIHIAVARADPLAECPKWYGLINRIERRHALEAKVYGG